MQWNTAQQQKGMNPQKDWDKPMCILLSERIHSEEPAHGMTPSVTLWERQSYVNIQIMGRGR